MPDMSHDPVTKLVLVAHLRTKATQDARFPLDEVLLPVELSRERSLNHVEEALVLRGPEKRTTQTATTFSVAGAKHVDELADLDMGAWRGLGLNDVDPGDLGQWMTDPDFDLHGGESIRALVDRVASLLKSCIGQPRVVAFTSPAVVRAALVAALGAPAQAWFQVDAGPGTILRLHYRSGRWRLRLS